MEFTNAGQAAAITRALHDAGARGVSSEYWNDTVVVRARFADFLIIRNMLLDKGYEAQIDSTSPSEEIVWITVSDRKPLA